MPDEMIKKRGRPKDQELRNRILDTARELFFAHGYQSASMDAIAHQAAVSNRTVYSHFANKEELLWAVMEREGELFRPRMPEAMPKSCKELRLQLCDFGRQFIRLLSSPNIIAMGRVLISECVRHQEMAEQFYRWGPQQTQHFLGSRFEFAIAKDWIAHPDPMAAAHQLLALWQADWHLRQQLGLQRPLTPKQIATYADSSVDFFLKAVTARPRA